MSSFKKIRLGEKDNPVRVRRVKRVFKKFIPILLLVAIFTILALFFFGKSSSTTVINYIFNLSPLKTSEGRVNVLLLGMAGGRHDGATLTDTILIASYNLKSNQLHLISIPRDLWIPPFSSKSNAIYQLGSAQDEGALGFAETVMGNIVGLPISYGLRVDFQGFIDAVDVLGGIDVEIERTFDDFLFPVVGKEDDLCGYIEEEREFSEEEAKKLNIEIGKRKVFISPEGEIATDSAEEDKGYKYFSCRYEHIHFEKGTTHMDGDTALKFVRSRHGTNGEGSDFSRSKRQERVITAIRKNALSFETLTSPKKLGELVDSLKKSIDTDISIKDGIEFFKLSKKLEETYSVTIDDSKKEGLPEGRTSLLIHPPASDYGGAYVLISQDDDFSFIHDYIKNLMEEDQRRYEASSSARSSN